ENEQAARAQEQIVRNREEVLKDVLCLTNYQQARAVRLAGRPGWRAWALELLKNSAELRTRLRDAANPDDKTVEIPDASDLRSEAGRALIGYDVRQVREIPLNPTSLSIHSPEGGQVLRDEWDYVDQTLRVIDLTTGRDLHRVQPSRRGRPGEFSI